MVDRKALGAYFKKVDFFATDVAFRENGGNSFGTIFGACVSLLIALIVSSYGFSKFVVMINYEDTRFNDVTEENSLSDDEFGQEELQFQIAFGLFDFYYDNLANSEIFKANYEQFIDFEVAIWNRNSTGKE